MSSSTTLRVVVVGGGIAGLAVARACQQVGIEVTVLEKTQELRNIGGGMTIYPHGMRALTALGLEEGARSQSHSMKLYRTWVNDECVREESLNSISATYGWSYHSFARHDLQRLLAESLAPKTLQLGHAVEEIQINKQVVEVRCEGAKRFLADLVVCADGIHSSGLRGLALQGLVLQGLVRGLEQMPEKKFLGYGFWGGIVSEGNRIEISENSLNLYLGHRRVSWILTLPNERQWWYVAAPVEQGDFKPGTDSKAGTMAHVRRLCQGWNTQVEAMLGSPQDGTFGLPVYGFSSTRPFCGGPVVALGDSAHAMGPTTGQGANAALVDAVVLVQRLSRLDDQPGALEDALSDYTQMRNSVIEKTLQFEMRSAENKLSLKARPLEQQKEDVCNESALERLRSLHDVITAHPEMSLRSRTRRLPGGG